jgi:hypothetical protein
MSKIGGWGSSVQRTRRNLAKAAGVALTALLAMSVRPTSASAHSHDPHPCFLKGTRIRTTRGYRKVEELAIGDVLPAKFGGLTPIQWIGRYQFEKIDQETSWAKDCRPVRVMRSALDGNVPNTDLYVTAGHAFFIDGVLVPAGNLINGTTITLDEAEDFNLLEYFHIKLENHDVIDAEGAPCESLLSVNETANNFAEYIRSYGAPQSEHTPCAPVVSFDGGRSEVKSRLRSAASSWVDRRQKLDIIRDRLEERGIALCHNIELARTSSPPAPPQDGAL